jgi:hypothetical protein
MMTELMFYSLETIARRSWMLAQGKCSPTEFARMVLEKQQALSLSGFTPERGLRGIDTGSLPPWRDGKREALAP